MFAYKYFEGKSKPVKAHRYSYEFHKGKIGPGLHVCHTCDIRSCVNPDHLWLGTSDQNNKDKANKGRAARQPGESHGMSKLTQSDVDEIRKIYSEGGVSQASLSRKYGIGKPQICRIIKRQRWV